MNRETKKVLEAISKSEDKLCRVEITGTTDIEEMVFDLCQVEYDEDCSQLSIINGGASASFNLEDIVTTSTDDNIVIEFDSGLVLDITVYSDEMIANMELTAAIHKCERI